MELTADHSLWLPEFHGQALHQDHDEGDAEGDDDDDDENGDGDGDDDESGEAWDSAVSRDEAAGYAHEGFPMLAAALAGGGKLWPPAEEEQAEWSLQFDSVAGWISESGYERVKAWCGE